MLPDCPTRYSTGFNLIAWRYLREIFAKLSENGTLAGSGWPVSHGSSIAGTLNDSQGFKLYSVNDFSFVHNYICPNFENLEIGQKELISKYYKRHLASLQGQPKGQLKDGQRGAESLSAKAERCTEEAARHHGPQDQVSFRVIFRQKFKIQYRVRHQVSSKVLLLDFLAVP